MRIAIVGGGPAGAHLCYCLAREGIEATVFDGSHPREKPCGGGLSALAIRKFPFLRELHYGCDDKWLRLVSPSGKGALITGEGESMSVSRKRLDALILERAMEEGGKLRREMVTDFGRKGDGWAIKTRNGIFRADLIVGADGVNSLVRRKLIGPITSENLGLCVGCFAKGSKRRREITTISFLRGIEGYAWLFPRENDLSIGVGSDPKNGRLLRGELDKFMKRYARDAKITSRWGAMLPLPKDPHFLEAPVSGGNWLLAGDAAGHADPLTGEGITYALWSGELAAKAIAAGDTGSYEGLWRRAYGNSIAEGIKTRKLFYNNEMLEIIVRFAARSRTFGSIVYDLIESGQDYGTLPKRVARQLPKALLELV